MQTLAELEAQNRPGNAISLGPAGERDAVPELQCEHGGDEQPEARGRTTDVAAAQVRPVRLLLCHS